MDFTSDAEILENILPYVPKDVDRGAFLTSYYAANPDMLAGAFLELADAIKDDKLRKETRKQFKRDLEKLNNE